MSQAILVFLKNDIPGKVKTRLAEDIGDARARDVYRKLVAHTCSVVSAINCDLNLYYSTDIPDADIWPADARRRIQHGSDLGQRMHHALAEVIEHHDSAILIGSDCFDLTTADLEEALGALHYTDVVIGPARDGGYYLIGMHTAEATLFADMPWSTDRVFQETREVLLKEKKEFVVLAMRTDVDTVEDLKEGFL